MNTAIAIYRVFFHWASPNSPSARLAFPLISLNISISDIRGRGRARGIVRGVDRDRVRDGAYG